MGCFSSLNWIEEILKKCILFTSESAFTQELIVCEEGVCMFRSEKRVFKALGTRPVNLNEAGVG
jgi:hypothetical protein